jgi:type I restriction enzyme M protein
MYIHGIVDYHLEFGDTFLYPKFKDGEGIRKFNVVLANPPWNQDGYDEDVLKKGEFWRNRFPFGFATRSSADWVWIQHMMASADETTGRVGIVIDNGCLFRGGKEAAVRSKMLEENTDLIECVILLPEKLFYNTGAPGAILILTKNKPAERKKKVLFINASKESEQHPEVRKLNTLADKHTDKIANAYRSFSEEEGFSRVVSLGEIEQNDYNLNVTLYVMPVEEGEPIDITKEYAELKQLDKERREVAIKLDRYLSEIGRSIDGKDGFLQRD